FELVTSRVWGRKPKLVPAVRFPNLQSFFSGNMNRAPVGSVTLPKIRPALPCENNRVQVRKIAKNALEIRTEFTTTSPFVLICGTIWRHVSVLNFVAEYI